MELSEDEIFEKKMKNNVAIVIETHYYHTNTNLLAFHADIA